MGPKVPQDIHYDTLHFCTWNACEKLPFAGSGELARFCRYLQICFPMLLDERKSCYSCSAVSKTTGICLFWSPFCQLGVAFLQARLTLPVCGDAKSQLCVIAQALRRLDILFKPKWSLWAGLSQNVRNCWILPKCKKEGGSQGTKEAEQSRSWRLA